MTSQTKKNKIQSNYIFAQALRIRIILMTRLITLLIMLLFLKTFAFADTNKKNVSDKKPIQIACLPHKTFSNADNTVKILNAIEIRSKDADFGGISGLLSVDNNRKIYLLSDRGALVSANTVLNPANNALDCLKNVLISPIRGKSTNPLVGHYADAEGISRDLDKNKILISFERHHRVVAYPPSANKLLPQENYPALEKRELPFNESYESVLRLQDKSLIAFPERHELIEGVLRGFLLQSDGKTVKNLNLKRIGGFWLTDIAELANGDFVTLERSFNIFSGMAMQMRHIVRQDLLSGDTADGKIIMRMQSGDGVDNFEGLDNVPQSDGTNIMYVVSDDNFSDLQKTLILSLSYKP